MKNLAILGCDSTHVEVYTDWINNRAPQFNARVTAIWGEDLDQARSKAKSLGIANVFEQPSSAVQNVDGVLILSRFPENHAHLAKMCLQLRLPTFVDKLLSEDPAEAARVIELSVALKIPLMSCSPYRFSPTVEELKRSTSPATGRLAVLCGPRECNDLGENPKFKRLSFYGIHSVEAALEIFGNPVGEFCSVSSPNGTVGLLHFENLDICTIQLLSGLSGEEYKFCFLHEQNSNWVRFGFDAEKLYLKSTEAIMDQLFLGRKRVELENHLRAIQIIHALEHT